MLSTIGKKDSLVDLIERYESTLHRADHIKESPQNSMDKLLQLEDLKNDDYSTLQSPHKNSTFVKSSDKKTKKIDTKIFNMASKIRSNQGWYTSKATIEDFKGDEKALMDFKL